MFSIFSIAIAILPTFQKSNPNKTPLLKHLTNITDDYHLPSTVTPFWYDLTIRIYLPGTTFYGQVTSQIRISTPTNTIQISSDGLDVYYGFIIGANFVSKVIHFESKPSVRKVILHLDRQIASSDVRLTLYYRGFYSKDFKGLYVAQYNDQGKKKQAVLSFNSPIGARKMVPCFDEIAFKASWKVAVVHPAGTFARGNGPVSSKTLIESGKYYKTSFEPTKVMSSYLLAIGVGEMFAEATASGHSNSGILVNVFSKQTDSKRAKNMLPAYLRQLDYLERRFGVPLKVKKIDNVVFPEFLVQGMENEGLISFSEKVPSIEYAENAGLITHELVHQWIGNSATPKSWALTFLKEGIATFYEKEFAINPMTFANGMECDSWMNSHALLSEPRDLFELSWNFDDIVYQKGGAVFSMLRWLIGTPKFDFIMKQLILKFSDSTFDVADFVNLLDTHAHRSHIEPSLGTFFKTWISQPNFPILTVSAVSGGVIITAKPFYYIDGTFPSTFAKPTSFPEVRPIPLWYRFSNDPSTLQFAWMYSNETKFIPNRNIANYIFLNTDNYGFYRVHYDALLYRKMVLLIRNDYKIEPNFIDRLLVDSWPLVASGHLSIEYLVELLEAVRALPRQESTLIRTLHVLNSMMKEFAHLQEYDVVKEYVFNYFKRQPENKHINFPGGSALIQKYFHAADVKLHQHECLFGVEICAKEYENAFHSYLYPFCKDDQMLSDCHRVTGSLEVVICAAIQTNPALFDYFLQKYEIEEDYLTFYSIAAGFACTTEDIDRLFDLLTTPHRQPHIDPAHYSLLATAMTTKHPDQMQRLFLAKLTEPDVNAEFLIKTFSRAMLSMKADYGHLMQFSRNHARIYAKYRPAFDLAMEKSVFRSQFEHYVGNRIGFALKRVA
uniref:Peptidase_M1 domain-containing protein n=1 Tax=Panagrellus redivivus TaxID=6233 RepID=A0A7E4WBR1_PANRE